jgi:DNA-binding YbaB/EbfC family protein
MRPNPNAMRQMQNKLAEIQDALANETVEASVGGGVVTVTMTGHQKVVSVKISPEAIDPADPAMLEDLITAAVNEAVEKSQQLTAKRMDAITRGLGMPRR